MANKKILYTGTDGKIRELASGSGANIVWYDDTPNAELVKTKNVSFTTMSFNNGNVGLPIVKNNVVTMLTASELDYVGWDNIAKTWKFMRGEYVTLTGLTASANSDLSGTYLTDIKVKSLSYVRTGTLGVQYGGTGLGSGSGNNSFSSLTGEAILLGSGSNPFTLLTASQATSAVALASDGTGWTYVTQSVNNTAEVQVFTTPGPDTWTKPTGTKAIRVLVQGGGGGGGSGANRNSGVAALGGAGGSAGAFADSGILTVDDGFLTASVTVGSGGIGAVYTLTNSAGVSGQNGNSSSFGDLISANGGIAGAGGNINSSTTSSGGSSAAASLSTYDTLNYNNTRLTNAGQSGSSNSTTAGVSNIFVTSSTSYYDAGGGPSGGSLAAFNYTTNYAGGNGSSTAINSGSTAQLNGRSAVSSSATSSIDNKLIYPQDIFLASGGGGGASAAVTEGLGDVLALAHHNITNPLKDNSIWNNTVVTGATTTIITTASIPQVNSLFLDGILSSSALATVVGTTSSYHMATGQNIGTGSFSIESFFRLSNTGSSPASDLSASCYLLNAGYSGGLTGCLLGINKPNGGLRLWSSGSFSSLSSSPIPLNQWHHIVLQRSGSELQAYLNGIKVVSGSGGAFTNSVNNFFGYSLGPYTSVNGGLYSFNGYAKELRVLNRFQTLSEIQATYSGALVNSNTGSFADPNPLQSYPGGLGGNGAWGSGGGGGGASTNYTGSLTQQGGNGGDGYVAVISYKY